MPVTPVPELLLSAGEYHQRTKHRFEGYATGPETIDWDAQPDPFRRFDGAPLTLLPLVADDYPIPFSALYSGEGIEPQPLSLNAIGLLLEISLALSAWKQVGSTRWSLRCNPSSGNLHPTEAYLITGGIDGLEDGVYHYRADVHGLEQRCRFDAQSLTDRSTLMIGLSSVHWREAWKYGERAFRYCQHDVGHGLAALGFGASVLGWSVAPLYHLGDDAIARLLGIDREKDFGPAEREYPDLLLEIRGFSGITPAEAPEQMPEQTNRALDKLINQVKKSAWVGRANVLDAKHFYSWSAIDAVTSATQRPPSAFVKLPEEWSGWPDPTPSECAEQATRLFRSRRSAQAFDGITAISRNDFFRLLDHLLPRTGLPPWNLLPWQPRLHLVLFVHRVEGLKPGLYCLPRRKEAVADLQAAMRDEFTWQTVDTAPDHLPLYELVLARAERTAAQLSCHQAIAGDSAFSLGMLAEFAEVIAPEPWCYRELFWEAGAIGQVLYLEAEAIGLQGTGIGCYFDDPFHNLLGLDDNRYQSIYHFTVGGGVNDIRIISLPPYGRRG